MGMMSAIDIDLQDLVATIETLRADGYNLEDADSEAGLEARAVLLDRMTDLNWLTPTAVDAGRRAFERGDGQTLMILLGGATVDS